MAKLDKIYDRLSSIDSTLSSQHEVLKEHIRRTEVLESEIKPVQRHVTMVEGAIKFIGLLALIVGLIEGGKHLL